MGGSVCGVGGGEGGFIAYSIYVINYTSYYSQRFPGNCTSRQLRGMTNGIEKGVVNKQIKTAERRCGGDNTFNM